MLALVPGEQAVGAAAPAQHALPIGQSSHCDCPARDWNLPLPQREQAAADAPAYVPGTQGCETRAPRGSPEGVAPVGHACPGWQAWQSNSEVRMVRL